VLRSGERRKGNGQAQDSPLRTHSKKEAKSRKAVLTAASEPKEESWGHRNSGRGRCTLFIRSREGLLRSEQRRKGRAKLSALRRQGSAQRQLLHPLQASDSSARLLEGDFNVGPKAVRSSGLFCPWVLPLALRADVPAAEFATTMPTSSASTRGTLRSTAQTSCTR